MTQNETVKQHDERLHTETHAADDAGGKLLEVKDLHVSFFTPAGEVKAVGGISYSVNYGEVMGIVGESGSGKSVEAYSVIGLLQSPGKVIGGSITFEGEDVLAFTKDQMTDFRGNKVAMIFQNPMTCLNPVYTVGNQLIEALKAHDKSISKEDAAKRAMEMLELVGINNVEKRMKQYPHEFSGGMRQRVMIAMGLICHPKLLIADEPTTALDVTIQAQILELMKDLQKKGRIWASSLLPTIWAWWPRSATRSASCTPVRWWNRDLWTISSITPLTPTPWGCCAPCPGWTPRAMSGSSPSRERRWTCSIRPRAAPSPPGVSTP